MALFAIVEEIDSGAFGRVEKVRLANGKLVARKVFAPSHEVVRMAQEDLATLKRRFRREVETQSRLNPDLFMPVLDRNLAADPPWFTMPLADRNLKDEIEQQGIGNVAAATWADILDALEDLHNLGFVHRDLKPQNILLHEGSWKLSDLGLIQPLFGDTTRVTASATHWGTDLYCSPEQLQDFNNCRPTADIFAMGCILHDAYVGTPRVPYRPCREEQSAIGAIGWVIEKCTEDDPRKRFPRVGLLRSALLGALAKASEPQPTPTAGEWDERLATLDEWNPEQFGGLTRFLRDASREDVSVICLSLSEEMWVKLRPVDQDAWRALAGIYCDWCREGAFDFAYCDVMAQRLETIFKLGEVGTKADVAVSMARLGASHNRWFVMRVLLRLCGLDMDLYAARRTGIEIHAGWSAATDFMVCARTIGREISDYHPDIHEAIAQNLPAPRSEEDHPPPF